MSHNNEIEKRLWEAADQLRANSGLKYSQFSRPLLGLIFLRYADYKFAQAQKELEKTSKIAPEKGTIDVYLPRRKKISASDYQAKGVIYLPENARYSYILDLPEKENIGRVLNEAMKAIETENDDLKGVLDTDYSEIEDSVLIALLKLFSIIKFNYNDDIFGQIYEYFLGKFALAEGQRAGEFFTPESLVKLIVEIIEPKEGRIYDPACGSGGMFVHSANFIRKYGKNPMNEIGVYGQEKTPETIKLCKMNLAVHGITGDIKQGNTYYEDNHTTIHKFDYVMANPPFNVSGVEKNKLKNDKRYSYGVPNADNANFLWIQIFLNALNENGRAGFVMANSASDITGSEFEIRKKIIEDNLIDVMILIGPNFFFNVALSCTLWFIDKKKSKNQEKVLFINARNIYHQVDRAHRIFLPDQIEFISNIVKLYRQEKNIYVNTRNGLMEKFFPNNNYNDVIGLCKVTSIEEIKSKNYSLNPGRYVGVLKEKLKKKEFYTEISELHEKLGKLNLKSKELEGIIEENLKKLVEKNE